MIKNIHQHACFIYYGGEATKDNSYFSDMSIQQEWWWWERVLLCVWMLMTLVLTRSYSSNLMSLLAVRYIPLPIQTLQDLLDRRATLILHKGTAQAQAFLVKRH